VLACCPCDAWQQVLKDALGVGHGYLHDLPSPYRDEHLENAGLTGSLMETGTLSDEDEQKLCAAAGGRSIEAVRAFLNVADPDDISDEIGEAEAAPETPDIVFTSLLGSKGLSAEHVFIIGMNNSHFPRHADAVTDDEVCSLVVALSRTRKRCHVISFRWFGKDFLSPSLFLNWIGPHLETLTVNRDYDFSD
jgi:superfamily I DNA/RNA helicase